VFCKINDWPDELFWQERFIEFLNFNFAPMTNVDEIKDFFEALLSNFCESFRAIVEPLDLLYNPEDRGQLAEELRYIEDAIGKAKHVEGMEDGLRIIESLNIDINNSVPISGLLLRSEDIEALLDLFRKCVRKGGKDKKAIANISHLLCLSLLGNMMGLLAYVIGVLNKNSSAKLTSKEFFAFKKSLRFKSKFNATLLLSGTKPRISLIKFKDVDFSRLDFVMSLIRYSVTFTIKNRTELNKLCRCQGCGEWMLPSRGEGPQTYHGKTTIPERDGTQCKDAYQNRKKLDKRREQKAQAPK
jgi:hypothetical protein